METTIRTHIEELQLSAERMLLFNSDNKVLISYFKDLTEKLVYLKKLSMIDSRFKWNEIENIMDMLQKKDSELTHIDICFELKDVTTEKKEARLTIKK